MTKLDLHSLKKPNTDTTKSTDEVTTNKYTMDSAEKIANSNEGTSTVKSESKDNEKKLGISLSSLTEKMKEERNKPKKENKVVSEDKKDETKKQELFLNYKPKLNSIDFNPKKLLEKKVKPRKQKKIVRFAIGATSMLIIAFIFGGTYMFMGNQNIDNKIKTNIVESNNKTELITDDQIKDNKVGPIKEPLTLIVEETEYAYTKITAADGGITYEFDTNVFEKYEELEKAIKLYDTSQNETGDEDLYEDYINELIRKKILERFGSKNT